MSNSTIYDQIRNSLTPAIAGLQAVRDLTMALEELAAQPASPETIAALEDLSTRLVAILPALEQDLKTSWGRGALLTRAQAAGLAQNHRQVVQQELESARARAAAQEAARQREARQRQAEATEAARVRGLLARNPEPSQ